MPGPTPFLDFLRRHAKDDLPAFERAHELGCLLDLANPTWATQKGARVVPLVRNDGRKGRVLIGRDAAECDVVLAGDAVSRRHAYLELGGTRILLCDLGSIGGTHIGSRQCPPLQPVPLPSDAISELWFGEEAFFHFGPRALHDYLQHIGKAALAEHAPAPAVAPEVVRAPAPAGPPAPTRRLERSPAPTAAEEARRTEAWQRALAAVVQLAPTARAVEVVLAIDERPITIFDAERDAGGLPRALQALDALRDGVQRIQVGLRRTGFPVVVFERAGVTSP